MLITIIQEGRLLLQISVMTLLWRILTLFDPPPEWNASKHGDVLSPSQLDSSEFRKVIENCYQFSMLPVPPGLEYVDPPPRFRLLHSALSSWSACLILLRRREGLHSGYLLSSSLCGSWASRLQVTSMLLDAYMHDSYDSSPEHIVRLLPLFDIYLKLPAPEESDVRDPRHFERLYSPSAVVARTLFMCQLPQYTDVNVAAISLILFIEYISHWRKWTVHLVEVNGHIPLMQYLWKTEKGLHSKDIRADCVGLPRFKLIIILTFVINLCRVYN